MNVYKIDIKQHLNHKLVYDDIFEEHKGLEGSYLLKESVNNLNFDLLDFDNLSCFNQNIIINQKINKLNIIGFSTWGSNVEIIKINYKNFSEDVSIALLDWTDDKGYDLQNLGNYNYKSEIYVKLNTEGNLKREVYIHKIIIEIKKDMQVESIQLPNNFFMHIFKIEVER